jgi:hypothetical protein
MMLRHCQPVPSCVIVVISYPAPRCRRYCPHCRRNFIDLFHAIAMGDGRRAGVLLIERVSVSALFVNTFTAPFRSRVDLQQAICFMFFIHR